MTYDVVVATRNRIAALQASVPLFLTQSRMARQFIVVDASDDHDAVRDYIERACAAAGTKAVVIGAARGNLPEQRNRGLERVRADVVMFPDDDSLWWPDTAQMLMRVYERDSENRIGGVSAAPVPHPPQSLTTANYQMSLADAIRQRTDRLRKVLDETVWPDPLLVHGRGYWPKKVPSWFEQESVNLVEYIGGYRMSFRADSIRSSGGFDERLGGRIGWAAGEDADACFRVAQRQLLVGARNARMCHYRFPGSRANGFKQGMFMLLNRAYIVCKYSDVGSVARRAMSRFALGKAVYYMAAVRTRWGRDQLRGLRYGIKRLPDILNAPKEQLYDVYAAAADEGVKMNEGRWK